MILKIPSLSNFPITREEIKDLLSCTNKNKNIFHEEKKRIPWTQKDDNLLKEMLLIIKENERNKKNFIINWKLIENCVTIFHHKNILDHLRSGKQCRERWINHLEEKVKKDAWTEEEEKKLFESTKNLGHKWSEISKLIKGRTDNCVKNHYYSNLRKKVRRMIKYSDWMSGEESKNIKNDLEKLFPLKLSIKNKSSKNKIDCELIYKLIKIIDVSFLDIDQKLILFVLHIIDMLEINSNSKINEYESSIFDNYKIYENKFVNKDYSLNTFPSDSKNYNKKKENFNSNKIGKFQSYETNSYQSQSQMFDKFSFHPSMLNQTALPYTHFNKNLYGGGILFNPYNLNPGIGNGNENFINNNNYIKLKENENNSDNISFFILNDDKKDKSANLNDISEINDNESLINIKKLESDFEKKFETKKNTYDFSVNDEASQFYDSYKFINPSNIDLNNFLKMSDLTKQNPFNSYFENTQNQNDFLNIKRNRSDDNLNSEKVRIIKSNEILEKLAIISNPEKIQPTNTVSNNAISNLNKICQNNKMNTTYLRDIVKDSVDNDDLSLIKNFVLKEKTKSIIISDDKLVSSNDPLTSSSNDKSSIGIFLNKKINENECKKIIFNENYLPEEIKTNDQFKFNEPKNIDANIATDKLVEDNQILKKPKDISQDYNIVKKD